MEYPKLMRASIYDSLKKTLDFFISLSALIILSPLLLAVMCIIKIAEPKSPVFFSQVRLGKNKKPFKIYKFRTMSVDAESQIKNLMQKNEIKGPMFKIKKDPRVTKIGAFLRKTSIDEFPQPPLPREVAEYNAYELKRLAVTPGCTGLWQVSGRNGLNFNEMVELDLHYIENRSILMDITIMIKTIFVIVGEKNGY